MCTAPSRLEHRRSGARVQPQPQNRRPLCRDAPEAPAYAGRDCPADLAPDQLAHVVRRLEICKTIRATTLYREVTELGYEASYVSFARRVRLLRTIEPKEPEVRFETDPGVQVQMDWTELGRWQLADAMVELKAWVAVLGFSRAVALRFATDKTRATTLELIPQVLNDLGGTPQEILTDRDPALVIGETSDKRAIFASEWADLAVARDHAQGVPGLSRQDQGQGRARHQRDQRGLPSVAHRSSVAAASVARRL